MNDLNECYSPYFLFCRRAFLQLSSSPEAFFTLRYQFVRSYAVQCICHYVLGIGDRHASNMMIDTETGGALGIDFGHAFGSATQVILTRMGRHLGRRNIFQWNSIRGRTYHGSIWVIWLSENGR